MFYQFSRKEEFKSRFNFVSSGHGHYKVYYYTPSMKYYYVVTTDNMPLIDATKNEENPTWQNLNYLRHLCVMYGSKKVR